MLYNMPPPVRGDAYAHAREQWPHEACGFVIDGEYYPVPNQHPYPERRFAIDRLLFEQARATGKLEAIVHSHTYGQASPSVDDMEAQAKEGIPWVIIVMRRGQVLESFAFPADLDGPIVEGADYRFGVEDCYVPLRRWAKQHWGFVLPDFPRSEDFWERGDDLFVRHLEATGFQHHCWKEDVLTGRAKIGIGDVGVMRWAGSKFANHMMIYSGGNQILHHLHERLARREPAEPWVRRTERWLRFCPEAARHAGVPLARIIR